MQHDQRWARLLLADALLCGHVQLNSFSTASTTLPSCLPEASKNISRVSLQGSDPLNSGGPAVFAPLAVLRSHLAAFWMVTSLGLNWKGMPPRSAPAGRLGVGS